MKRPFGFKKLIRRSVLSKTKKSFIGRDKIAPMMKAVIFDLGGVIVDINPFVDEVLTIFQPVNEDEFWEEVNIEAASLCKGKVSLLQFWRNVAQKCEKGIPDNILKDLWVIDPESPPSLNEGIPEIIMSLKRNYKLAILSNTMREHKIDKKVIFELFDVIILSYEVGLTKDDKAVFLLVADKLGVTPQECVFIDDIHQFVEVAQSVGMKGILYENVEQLQSDLRRLRITV